MRVSIFALITSLALFGFSVLSVSVGNSGAGFQIIGLLLFSSALLSAIKIKKDNKNTESEKHLTVNVR